MPLKKNLVFPWSDKQYLPEIEQFPHIFSLQVVFVQLNSILERECQTYSRCYWNLQCPRFSLFTNCKHIAGIIETKHIAGVIGTKHIAGVIETYRVREEIVQILCPSQVSRGRVGRIWWFAKKIFWYCNLSFNFFGIVICQLISTSCPLTIPERWGHISAAFWLKATKRPGFRGCLGWRSHCRL